VSRLRIFSESDPAAPLFSSEDHAAIAARLGSVGVRYEQWRSEADLAPGTPPEQVIEAYRKDIERLKAEGGYQAVDVISLAPDHPEREALRRKFLDEHTHAEDEVRFFVAGSGLFSLHIDDRVYEVRCEAGDLIGVPHGTRHWFDMGPRPNFIAIRMFTNPAGWVANFTGDGIASGFPRYD
jgi:1,2-dihydroxy-3-keto-5-methylthiopentene dioxygenase